MDKSNLYEASAQYNFDRLVDVAEILVGGNYRVYDLNSDGSLFADANRNLSIREYGAYAQAERGFFGERLRLTGTLRLDKNENFAAQLSPRFSAVYTLAGQHNLRVSYQTAFRNPTTQDQYQNIPTPGEIIIGGLPEFRDRYNMIDNPVYSRDNVDEFHEVYDQAIDDGTAPADALAEARAVLEPYEFGEFKPEQLRSIEFGYRGRLLDERLFLDGYYYYNFYDDFLGSIDLVQSDSLAADGTSNPIGFLTGDQNVYDTPVNVQGETVTTQGFGMGGGYRLPADFTLEGNVAYNVLNEADDEDLNTPSYNTPAWRTNVSLSYRDRARGMGAKVSFRHQSAYESGGGFTGDVPAINTVDAQVTFDLSALNTRLKIGGSNILNDRHFTGYGNPTIGTQVYVSVTYDQFLN